MRTVSLILLLTASARALLKPSPTARTMASRCLRAFFDSSLISLARLRDALRSQESSSAAAAAAPDALNTSRRRSLSRQAR